MTQHPLAGHALLIVEASRSLSDTPQSVGLLWTRDQPEPETSTWQHTIFTTDRLACPRRCSNPQSQQTHCHWARLQCKWPHIVLSGTLWSTM